MDEWIDKVVEMEYKNKVENKKKINIALEEWIN